MNTQKNNDIPETPPPHPEHQFHSLMEIFDELSFREKWKKVFYGLRQPHDSGDFKYAKIQLQRLGAPAAAILGPLLIVLALLTVKATVAPKREYQVEIMDPEQIEQLDEEIEKLIEEMEPPEPMEMDAPTDESFSDVPTETDVAAPSQDFSPQPAALDSVAMVKSPVVLRGMLGSRNPGARGSLLGSGGGGAHTERSVYLALRWLKKYQSPDGGWEGSAGGGPSGTGKPAFVGLALLAFLAHGETPASEEFGPTVELAIKWLLDNQKENGDFNAADSHNYSQPIATYALCETFALTRIPMVKTAAEKSVARIIKGQNPVGYLWNYNFNPKELLAAGSPGERNDLSYAGWCMQALKAASTAGLEVEGLEEAKKKSVEGIRKLSRAGADGTVGFGYSSPSQDNITSAGTLCMQLLGAGKSKEVGGALQWLKRADCVWEKPWSESPIYHWYYITQVKFHAGGGVWADWNKQFSPALVKNQVVVKNAIEDTKGNLVDIGYWKSAAPKEHCQSYVYNTTLCALMLQVYYRYLPTYKTPEVITDEPSTLEDKDKDVEIEIL
jgi:hypothetical protein